VGREILQGLLADDSVSAVHSLGRRPLQLQHPKLTHHVVDFAALSATADPARLPALPAAGEVFLALGTTIKVAGSQAAFRAVDYDANLAVARMALASGATKAGVVSAMGADAKSSIFYNRVKGELEDALSSLGFATLVIARPSFLTGDRESLGQPLRGGEKLALNISRWLAPVIPDNLKSIPAKSVAGALLKTVPTASGKTVLLSGQMQAMAALTT
jgi:uncharacterized protein YbjT (DUF2867 family)